MILERYFEIIQIFCYSSNFHLLVLASIDNSSLNQLLLLWLPNGGLSMIRKNFLFSTMCLDPYKLMYIFSFYSMDHLLYVFILMLILHHWEPLVIFQVHFKNFVFQEPGLVHSGCRELAPLCAYRLCTFLSLYFIHVYYRVVLVGFYFHFRL